MQPLIDNFSIIMIVGVIAVVAVAQMNRLLGSIMGVIFWLAIAGLGTMVYDQGGGIGLAGMRFPQPVFYILCLILAGANAATAIKAQKTRTER